MNTSDQLEVGNVYTRQQLREMFSITDATLNTGVFQPPGHKSIWLFVTRDKTSDRTQYDDRLEGDELEWDGQPTGRTDDLIISHEARGVELLLFYRTEKYQFDGAGFRFEGRFRYVSHKSGKPSHFIFRRVSVDEGNTTLKLATTQKGVRESLQIFNRDARNHIRRAEKILRKTEYWVFDPSTGNFGASKFVAFDGMTFERYNRLNAGESSNGKFDGHVTKNAIEAALNGTFVKSADLIDHLNLWGTRLLGPQAFGRARSSKWQFISLKGVEPRELEKEAVAGAADAFERSGGQGFSVSPEVRKAIEVYAMEMATAHFREEGFSVEDVSHNNPYDLRCTKASQVLHVEVKGTRTKGELILLTRGEVELARKQSPATALFVLHSIKVNGTGSDVTVAGGQIRLIEPWEPDKGVLTPLAFSWEPL